MRMPKRSECSGKHTSCLIDLKFHVSYSSSNCRLSTKPESIFLVVESDFPGSSNYVEGTFTVRALSRSALEFALDLENAESTFVRQECSWNCFVNPDRGSPPKQFIVQVRKTESSEPGPVKVKCKFSHSLGKSPHDHFVDIVVNIQ